MSEFIRVYYDAPNEFALTVLSQILDVTTHCTKFT